MEQHNSRIELNVVGYWEASMNTWDVRKPIIVGICGKYV